MFAKLCVRSPWSSEWAPRASGLKICTAPQRERSDRPKVTRGLRQRSPGNRFVRDFLRKRKPKELLCCKGHQKRRTCMRPPRIMTPTGTEKVDFSIKKQNKLTGRITRKRKKQEQKEQEQTKNKKKHNLDLPQFLFFPMCLLGFWFSGLFFSVCSGYVFALLFIF